MKTFAYVVTVVGYAGLFAVALWILGIRPRRLVKDKIVGILQVVAIYTLVLGLLSQTGVFETFDWLASDLTSSDPLRFLRGNLFIFGMIYLAASVALDPSTSSSIAAYLLGLPVLFCGFFILLAYTVLHFLVVVPVVYFGYLITSVPIDAILHAGSDYELGADGDVLRIKQFVADNEVTMRNFAVALPAFVTSLVLKVAPLLRLRRNPEQAAGKS